MASNSLFTYTVDSLEKAQFNSASANGGQIYRWTYTSDSLASGGTTSNLTLSTENNWSWSAVAIHQIIISASASTDFDVGIYPDNNFTTNTEYTLIIDNNLGENISYNPLFYFDTSSSQNLYLQLINNDGSNASTITVTIIFSPLEKVS